MSPKSTLECSSVFKDAMKNRYKRTEKTVLLAHTGTGAGGSANEFAVERGERGGKTTGEILYSDNAGVIK